MKETLLLQEIDKVKTTKRQLKRIIREEKRKLVEARRSLHKGRQTVKISKRQLRRIIKEEKLKLSEYTRDPMERAYAKVINDYEAWVKERGHVTPAASSVLATYLVDQRLDKDAERVSILTSEYKMNKVDIEHELATARAEYEAGGVESEEDNYERGFYRESKMKITKRQLQRIIKEEKAKILAEIAPIGSATGDDISDEVYRQALQLFGSSAIIDEEDGELYIDTGLVDDDVEALYADWVNLWPDAMHEEGGLVYTGISV